MTPEDRIQRLERQILALKNSLILVMREVYKVPEADKGRLEHIATSLKSIKPPTEG